MEHRLAGVRVAVEHRAIAALRQPFNTSQRPARPPKLLAATPPRFRLNARSQTMAFVDFVSVLHKRTTRDYLARVNEFPKAEAAKVARQFGRLWRRFAHERT